MKDSRKRNLKLFNDNYEPYKNNRLKYAYIEFEKRNRPIDLIIYTFIRM